MVLSGPILDGEKNVYISAEHDLWKLSPDGQVLWSHRVEGDLATGISIHRGAVYGARRGGHVFALSCETGARLWSARPAASAGGDNHYVEAFDGIVVTGVLCPDLASCSGNNLTVGMDAATGEKLWEFASDTPTWNIQAHFDGNGSLVFQDWDAGVYRLGARDGKLIWRAGRVGGKTFTDGGALLGSNGIVYAVSASGSLSEIPRVIGGIHAYRLSDGKRLWEHDDLPGPVFAWPAVGSLRPGAPPSCVVPVGIMPGLALQSVLLQRLPAWALSGALTGVVLGLARPRATAALALAGALLAPCLRAAGSYLRELRAPANWFPSWLVAFDAETGAHQWTWALPPYKWLAARGEEAGFLTRWWLGHRRLCLPAAFSAPTIDSEGRVYIGHESGMFFSVRDEDGDGIIDERTEVTSHDLLAAPLPSGPSLAPGMLAMTTCDGLWVFK
mmetsp:Transcript_3659/g.10654  ORF Transcript_3659/g.10654 Transcript_3659/m.10654 type:complete len:444 (-) Transcript_3659:82-1413(-)